ncbi:oxidoreductase, partial [Pseudomonas syringae pv. tagetis]
MQRIIKNYEVIDETWHLLPNETTFDSLSYADDLIVRLALWRE